MSLGKVLVAACVSVALAGAVLVAQGKPSPQLAPISIDIPGVQDGLISLQTAGAWPLTIRVLASNPLGIGTYSVPYQYPLDSQQAFIVLKDPDDCFSLALAHDPDNPASTPCPGGPDETYIEFTPTMNGADLRKYPVQKVGAFRLGAAPTLLGWTEALGNNDTPTVGPFVGLNENDAALCADPDRDPNGVCDNYGYGASPNMPGLVILSDRGVGLMWDSGFNLFQPKAARNLAGLVNSVSWTLNDCLGSKNLPDGCANGRTSVTAHLNVPRNLFTPVVRLDLGKVDENNMLVGRAYQIDGGDIVPDNNKALLGVLNELVTTVRVFVVSGRGPDVLEDLDGNGVVDSKDARLAGYKVLSGDKVFFLRTYHQSYTPGNSDLAVLYDFDGNGMQGDVAPGGSGGVTGIPR